MRTAENEIILVLTKSHFSLTAGEISKKTGLTLQAVNKIVLRTPEIRSRAVGTERLYSMEKKAGRC